MDQRPKALITDYTDPLLVNGLKDMGYKVTYAPDISMDEVRNLISPYHILVINTKISIDRDLLDAATHLQCIGRLGSGLDHIDMVAARERGIEVFSAPEGNCNAVAEHAFGMLLMLLNKLHLADQSVRRGEWQREKHRGLELENRTIGIIGYGNTGAAFAQKFAGWKTEVLVYDKYKTHYAGDLRFVRECHLMEVLTRADIISLHVPLTDETRNMVNTAFIDRCKKGVLLINTARGHVLKIDDLVRALGNGRVGGACLDVLQNENPASYGPAEKKMYEALYAMEQVVLSPHVAGWTVESKRKIAGVLLQKMKRAAYIRND